MLVPLFLFFTRTIVHIRNVRTKILTFIVTLSRLLSPFPRRTPSRGHSLSRVLCRDNILTPARTCLRLECTRTCNTLILILKHDVLASGPLPIRSPGSLRSVYLKIGAQRSSLSRLKRPRRSSPTTQPTNVEFSTIMTI